MLLDYCCRCCGTTLIKRHGQLPINSKIHDPWVKLYHLRMVQEIHCSLVQNSSHMSACISLRRLLMELFCERVTEKQAPCYRGVIQASMNNRTCLIRHCRNNNANKTRTNSCRNISHHWNALSPFVLLCAYWQVVLQNLLMCMVCFYSVYYIVVSLCIGILRWDSPHWEAQLPLSLSLSLLCGDASDFLYRKK